MYNGWLHATFVTRVFCFGATGLVVCGKHNINIVGLWNDGDISRPFQEKISRNTSQEHAAPSQQPQRSTTCHCLVLCMGIVLSSSAAHLHLRQKQLCTKSSQSIPGISESLAPFNVITYIHEERITWTARVGSPSCRTKDTHQFTLILFSEGGNTIKIVPHQTEFPQGTQDCTGVL